MEIYNPLSSSYSQYVGDPQKNGDQAIVGQSAAEGALEAITLEDNEAFHQKLKLRILSL